MRSFGINDILSICICYNYQSLPVITGRWDINNAWLQLNMNENSWHTCGLSVLTCHKLNECASYVYQIIYNAHNNL